MSFGNWKLEIGNSQNPPYRIIAPYLFAIALCVGICLPFSAMAGFGVTPPYVKNTSLTRGTAFDQEIILVRSDPLEDLDAQVVISVPGAQDWITIDRGLSFIIPKGEKQTPIHVKVAVPTDAAFGEYKGVLRVRVAPKGDVERGTVSIALGAQIDVNLIVLDQQIIDFKIRRIHVNDLNEGHKLLWMFFPGKIRFTMQMENVGNVPVAPSKVEFDLRARRSDELLETTQNTNTLKEIPPFETGDVIAELPTRLKAASYRATYRIYKQDLVSQEGTLDLSILPFGTIPGDKGYGIMGLARRDQAILVIIGIAILMAIGYAIRLIRRSRRRRGNLPMPPTESSSYEPQHPQPEEFYPPERIRRRRV